MNIENVVIGIILIGLGIWFLIREIRIFARGKQDEQGYNAGVLVLCIGFIICGIILITKYW